MRLNLKWIILVFWATGGAGEAFAAGVQFLVSLDTNRLNSASDLSLMLERTSEVLRKRLDRLGVGQAIIEPQGGQSLLVAVAGVSERDVDAVRRLIDKGGYLEFRMVHPESAELVAQQISEPGYELLKERRQLPDGRTEVYSCLVNKKPERGMTGRYIKRAFVARNGLTDEPEIDFELDEEGAALFAQITTDYAPKGHQYHQLAIVLDGELCSAPRINSPITGGRGVIQGNFDLRAAFDLAAALENPLPVPLRVVAERSPLDPRLAQEFARRRTKSTVVAGIVALSGLLVLLGLVYGLSVLLGRKRQAPSSPHIAGPPPLPPSLRS